MPTNERYGRFLSEKDKETNDFGCACPVHGHDAYADRFHWISCIKKQLFLFKK